jgi:uncharacterized glyoxalase superfamily protein PhnB
MALALYPRVALAKDANVSPDGFGFCGITLACNTRTRDEVDAVLAQAGDAGAKLVKPAEEAFCGLVWYSAAKKEETRVRRVEKMKQMLLSGKAIS